MLEVYKQKPEGFSAQVQVAGCYLEIDQKILLLQYGSLKTESGKWGVPAGRLEEGETLKDAAARELLEETGILPGSLLQITQLSPLYICKPKWDFVFYLFYIQLAELPSVRLSEEHSAYMWATQEDLETLPLIDGAREAFQHCWVSIQSERKFL